MTPKIFLAARPANEGARRLVWLLLDRDLGARARLNRQGCSNAMIDRLVYGDVTPGLMLGEIIQRLSEGLIRARHWNAEPQAPWFERPAGWPDFGVLATSERRAA